MLRKEWCLHLQINLVSEFCNTIGNYSITLLYTVIKKKVSFVLWLTMKLLWKRKSWIMLVWLLLLASNPSDFNVTNLFLLYTMRDQFNSSVHFLESSFKTFSDCPFLLLHLSLACSIPIFFLTFWPAASCHKLQRKPRPLAPVNHRHDVIQPTLLHYFFQYMHVCTYSA